MWVSEVSVYSAGIMVELVSPCLLTVGLDPVAEEGLARTGLATAVVQMYSFSSALFKFVFMSRAAS